MPSRSSRTSALTVRAWGSGMFSELLRPVRPRPEAGLRRVVPLGIDRCGLTLRLEYPHTHHDARVLFESPVRHIDQFGLRIRALLAASRRLSQAGRLSA